MISNDVAPSKCVSRRRRLATPRPRPPASWHGMAMWGEPLLSPLTRSVGRIRFPSHRDVFLLGRIRLDARRLHRMPQSRLGKAKKGASGRDAYDPDDPDEPKEPGQLVRGKHCLDDAAAALSPNLDSQIEISQIATCNEIWSWSTGHMAAGRSSVWNILSSALNTCIPYRAVNLSPIQRGYGGLEVELPSFSKWDAKRRFLATSEVDMTGRVQVGSGRSFIRAKLSQPQAYNIYRMQLPDPVIHF
ncbi:hypothetical protein HYFRA_00009961 [Hymenoscyphus fraxineus]|uniref:Uncharacterized protein n=1 Tax=Hymenoscyphus fraxineus TaxID=746836 RepID=A0A9N9L3W6_9HELO|nr:hypothetical protein HYFRA_00009961 [Hymenoscyphus fraxineus]